MEIIIYGLICVFSTTIGAISGIGGGVIIKPALDLIGGLSLAAASFLSSCTVLSMSTVSVLTSIKSKVKIDPKRITPLAFGAALGGVLGKYFLDIAKVSHPIEIGLIQNLLIAVLIILVFFYLYFQKKIKTLNLLGILPCIAIGVLLGVKGAFLGIGGGPINLVILYFFFSMTTKEAVVNSIYVILFSQAASLLTTFISGTVPTIDPFILFSGILCGVAGGFIGRGLASKLSENQTKLLFTLVLLLIITMCIINIIKFSY